MKTSRTTRGYTLIELIVSLGVFSIVVTLAAGGYFIVLAANKKAQATTAAINNVSYALERMVRSMRTGTEYTCAGAACPSFSFTDTTTTNKLTYSLSGGAIQESIDSESATPITDKAVALITSITFYPVGTVSGATDGQARVTVVVVGEVVVGPGSPIPFTVETGATMRSIDI